LRLSGQADEQSGPHGELFGLSDGGMVLQDRRQCVGRRAHEREHHGVVHPQTVARIAGTCRDSAPPTPAATGYR
jgi:hypothetical protein